MVSRLAPAYSKVGQLPGGTTVGPPMLTYSLVLRPAPRSRVALGTELQVAVSRDGRRAHHWLGKDLQKGGRPVGRPA